MADVVAFVDDLFFQAKIAETAKQLGIELRMCSTPDALAAEISGAAPHLVVVDLNARGNPLAAAGRVRESGRDIPLIGFLSHVQTDLAAQANAAGFDQVMPRSQFTKNLATILSRAKSSS
jgi:CheY-like chemotaxis protein